MKKQFRDYDPAMKEVADELWKNTKESSYHLYSLIAYAVFLIGINFLFFTAIPFSFSLEPRKVYSVGGMTGTNPDFLMTFFFGLSNLIVIAFMGKSIYYFIDSKKEERKSKIDN